MKKKALLAIGLFSVCLCQAATVTTLRGGNFGFGEGVDDINPVHRTGIRIPPGFPNGSFTIDGKIERDGQFARMKYINFSSSNGQIRSLSPATIGCSELFSDWAAVGVLNVVSCDAPGFSASGSVADTHLWEAASSRDEFLAALARGTATVYDDWEIELFRPPDPSCTRDYDEKVLCPGDTRGMPRYNVHALTVSLNITDTPLSYRPAVGPPMQFTLSYNQRESGDPAGSGSTNFGRCWSCSWLSYVLQDPSKSAAEVRLGGGGSELFANTTGSNPHFISGAVLMKTAAGYERRLPDGSQEFFEWSDGATVGPRRTFLSRKLDRHGNAYNLGYERVGGIRLTTITDPLGHSTRIGYASGTSLKPTEVTDPYGRKARLEYNTTGELATITDQAGMRSEFIYDPGETAFIGSMATPYGTTSFAKGEKGSNRWLEITDPLGARERVEFRDRAPGISASDPAVPEGFEGANKGLDYNNTFFWDQQAMALAPGDYSKARIIHWLNNGQRVSPVAASTKAPLEGRVWYQYEGQTDWLRIGTSSRPIRVARLLEDGSSQVSRCEYDKNGNPIRFTDPLGRIRIFEYEGSDLVRVSQQRGGASELVRAFVYTPNHLLLRQTEANGAVRSWGYNSFNQMVNATDPLGQATNFSYFTNPGEPRFRQLKEVNRVGTVLARYDYDGLNRPSSFTNALGQSLSIQYEAIGGDPACTLDRPFRLTYPDGSFEEMGYNRLDPELWQNRIGGVTRFLFDARQRLKSVTDPLGRNTRFEWCSCGGLEALLDAAGSRTSWSHDLQGRVTTRTVGGDVLQSYTYGPLSGRLESVTDAMRQTTVYSYFPDGALRATDYQNALHPTASVHFAYDPANGQLVSVSDGTGATVYTYHALASAGGGRLAALDGPGGKIGFSYDAAGRLLERHIGGHSTQFSYDSLGRLAGWVTPLGATSLAYRAGGTEPSSVLFPNGVRLDCRFSAGAFGEQLESINYFQPNKPSLLRLDYTHDVLGRISSIREWGAAGTRRTQFEFDALSQLSGASVRAQGSPVETYSFAYDPRGNRVSSQKNGSMTAGVFNNLNQLVSTREGEGLVRFSGWATPGAAVAINGQGILNGSGSRFSAMVPVQAGTNVVTITAAGSNGAAASRRYQLVVAGTACRTLLYDLNGNLLSDGNGQSYEWDAADRLIAINDPDGTRRAEFCYDGLGRRIRTIEKEADRIVSEVASLWDGLQVVQEREGTRTKNFYPEGIRIETPVGNSSEFFLRDHLGSLRAVVDANGLPVASYTYDPFGQRTRVSGIREDELGLTGHRYHARSGLHLAAFRAYDARSGRWLSRDPLGEQGGLNLYAYVSNDPVNLIDPFGLMDFFANARVTAFAYGIDNAYEGHPDGSDHVALAADRSRIDRQGDSHAVLGDGSLAYPSSLAVSPRSGIKMGSKVYIEGIGWFVVEDVCARRLPSDTFDMWTGRQVDSILRALTGPRNVTVFGPRETIPENYKKKGAGLLWSFMPAGTTRVGERIR